MIPDIAAQLANYTPDQRLCIMAFQRTYGSVRVRRLSTGDIALSGFSRPRYSGRKRYRTGLGREKRWLVHRVLVKP